MDRQQRRINYVRFVYETTVNIMRLYGTVILFLPSLIRKDENTQLDISFRTPVLDKWGLAQSQTEVRQVSLFRVS